MTPEQEEQVRRLLGSLPPEGPLPPEVATRLDARLADLVAERTSAAAPASGDELAARRRRRRVTTGLVAAASVAVVGVALGTMADLTGSDSDSAQSGAAVSDSAAAAPESAPEAAREDSAGDAAGGADAGTLASVPDGVLLLAGDRQDVATANLDRDVARVAALAPAPSSREGVTGDRADSVEPGEARRRLATIAPCVVPAAEAGDVVAPVRLDGEPATLVLQAAAGGTREAQIYACDDATALLAATTVPTR
ncbi:MAG TPA: hypothetical protein VFH10_07350 [Nocardioides sp.]|uniref:hypothetical protein n=1 Tax=Nocardioides sp. TaxID=35761 RepID=UPI002D7FD2C3|nr:hypothetical protein [Nocardioides sp.]HET6652438.1 hypothetical protein [Nocardioides sp.]